jgi:signal transduction histidine kinase
MPRYERFQPARRACATLGFLLWLAFVQTTGAMILWSDPDARVIHNTPAGSDLIGGKVFRDDKASDALYFKFHVDPLSDAATENYYAVFQLYQGDEPRLAVGNAPEAWGYSAWNTSELGPSNIVSGEFNLMSSQPEAAGLGLFKPYEVVRHNQERTIVFKVQFLPDGDDLVTVWLNPNLTHGASAENQPPSLVTKFKANATFDQIRLRHEGKGNGWIFSDMAIATSFSDFVVVRFWQTWWFIVGSALMLLGSVAASVRLVEKRKYQRRLRLAEQERALERERARIAQDLHDDLGSSLTRIALLSDLLNAENQSPQQVQAHAEKITQTAAQTVQALEEIVWAVRPGSDSLQSLVEYIAHFSNELFEGNGTRCRLNLPHDLPSMPLPPEMRHNIFLVVKEALTNVLKHSGAREVHVQAKAAAHTLEFIVQDDGRGFVPKPSAGSDKRNGLTNMQRRAESMGGKLTVDSSPKGTTVKLQVTVLPASNLRKS